MADTDLLKWTRYYNGEQECPDYIAEIHRGRVFWKAEKTWCEIHGTDEEKEYMENLFEAGLGAADLETPVGLLATLFAYYCHYDGGENPFDVQAALFETSFLPDYIKSTFFSANTTNTK